MEEKPETTEKFKFVKTSSDLEYDLKKPDQIDYEEVENLLAEERRDIDEKTHLVKTFKILGTELQISKKKNPRKNL